MVMPMSRSRPDEDFTGQVSAALRRFIRTESARPRESRDILLMLRGKQKGAGHGFSR